MGQKTISGIFIDPDGAYSITLSHGIYSVTSKDEKRGTSLGTISIDDESESGSRSSCTRRDYGVVRRATAAFRLW